ncbi:GntR family transcriptional regulator [Streptomyces sp. 8N706]|uniref:GntR family transcriptional regulator n=1 Tax=Streptomyces sp. 8N706 TaxID=3457416 RepID=UPI003FD109C5
MSSDGWTSTSAPYLKPNVGGGSGDAWGADAAAHGRHGTQQILHAGEVPSPPVVARLLGVAEGETVVVRRRIMYLDEQPNELTDTFYPAWIAAGTKLAATVKIRGGAAALLAELGHTGRRVQEEVVARMPNGEERDLLRMEPDVPVLCLERLTSDADGRPIQADIMTMPADRQRLRYELTIG